MSHSILPDQADKYRALGQDRLLRADQQDGLPSAEDLDKVAEESNIFEMTRGSE